MDNHNIYLVIGLTNPHCDGYPVDSQYADIFWLPHLGPSSLALLRWITHQPNRRALIALPDLGAAIGIPNSRTITRTLDRLARSGLARQSKHRIELSLTIPPLHARHIAALPTETQQLHEALTGISVSTSTGTSRPAKSPTLQQPNQSP